LAESTPVSGELPEGWLCVDFGDLVNDVKESEREPIAAGLERYIGLEHLDPNELRITRWGNLNEDDVSFTKRFRTGQVLFGKRRAYQRKVAIAEFDGICSSDILTFSVKDDRLRPDLLPFVVQSDRFFDHALGTSSGSLSPRTRWSQLRDFEVFLPPLGQQEQIAEILKTAEALVSRRADVVKATELTRTKLIDELVPYPKQSSPEKVKSLGELCDMQNGRPFPSREYCDDGIKLLRPGNLSQTGYLDWRPDATTCVPWSQLDDNPDHVIATGDVVMNLTAQSLEDGFMGRVCLVRDGDESLLNQRLGRFVCSDELRDEYLFRNLQTSRFRRVVESRCEGSKVRHTYFRHFEDFKIVHLSIPEQDNLIERLKRVDIARKDATELLEKDQRLMRELQNKLLGGELLSAEEIIAVGGGA